MITDGEQVIKLGNPWLSSHHAPLGCLMPTFLFLVLMGTFLLLQHLSGPQGSASLGGQSRNARLCFLRAATPLKFYTEANLLG